MNATELLVQWQKGIRIWHIAHSRSAVRFARRGRLLGIPVVVLSTIVGTSIFTTIGDEASDELKLLVGLLSALAAVLAGLQTFLGYADLAGRHEQAARRFGELRRGVEMEMAPGKEPLQEVLADIRSKWNATERAAPEPPQALYDKARQLAGSRAPYGSNGG